VAIVTSRGNACFEGYAVRRLAAALVLLAACNSGQPKVREPVQPEPPRAAAPPTTTVVNTEPLVRVVTAEFAAAVFADKSLEECASIVVAVSSEASWVPPSDALSVENAALMFYDDFIVAAGGGKADLGDPGGAQRMAELGLALTTHDLPGLQEYAALAPIVHRSTLMDATIASTRCSLVMPPN
jgi:hypothetical protein